MESYHRGGLEKAGSGKYPRLGVRDPEREFEAGLRRLLAPLREDPAG